MPASAGGPARRRGPPLAAAAVRVLDFGTYDRALPAQRAGHLACAARASRCASGTRRSGSDGGQVVGRCGGCSRGSPRQSASSRSGDARTPTRARRLPRAHRPPGGTARRARAAGRLQSTRLAARHPRRRPGALPAAVAPARASPRRRPTCASARADSSSPTRKLTRSSSATRSASPPSGSRSASSAPRSASSDPGWRAETAVPRAVRRQADPAARARDDPRRCGARPRGPVPDRRERAARAAARRPPRPTSTGAWVEYERAARASCTRGLCARRLRHVRQGAARDSQQGLPGARLRRRPWSQRTRPPRASC